MTPDAAPPRPLPAGLRAGAGARGDVLPSTDQLCPPSGACLPSAAALKAAMPGATVSDVDVLHAGTDGGVPSAGVEADRFPDGGVPTTAGRSGRAACVDVPRRSAWPGFRERTVGAGLSPVTMHRPLDVGAGTSAGVGAVRDPLLSGARPGGGVAGGRLASDARRVAGDRLRGGRLRPSVAGRLAIARGVVGGLEIAPAVGGRRGHEV